VTLTFSNQRFCDQDDVGGELSGGRLYAPPSLATAVSTEGSYTLKQDIFGPYKRLNNRTGQVVQSAVAGNCVNYSYYKGDSIKLVVGRWPPDAGTFYWLYFTGQGSDGTPLDMEGVFSGGRLYDICTGAGAQPDLRAAFQLAQSGVLIKVTGAGRQWSVSVCVDVTISR
jgi:hypothetical protein